MYEWYLIDIGEVDKTRKAVPTNFYFDNGPIF